MVGGFFERVNLLLFFLIPHLVVGASPLKISGNDSTRMAPSSPFCVAILNQYDSSEVDLTQKIHNSQTEIQHYLDHLYPKAKFLARVQGSVNPFKALRKPLKFIAGFNQPVESTNETRSSGVGVTQSFLSRGDLLSQAFNEDSAKMFRQVLLYEEEIEERDPKFTSILYGRFYEAMRALARRRTFDGKHLAPLLHIERDFRELILTNDSYSLMVEHLQAVVMSHLGVLAKEKIVSLTNETSHNQPSEEQDSTLDSLAFEEKLGKRHNPIPTGNQLRDAFEMLPLLLLHFDVTHPLDDDSYQSLLSLTQEEYLSSEKATSLTKEQRKALSAVQEPLREALLNLRQFETQLIETKIKLGLLSFSAKAASDIIMHLTCRRGDPRCSVFSLRKNSLIRSMSNHQLLRQVAVNAIASKKRMTFPGTLQERPILLQPEETIELLGTDRTDWIVAFQLYHDERRISDEVESALHFALPEILKLLYERYLDLVGADRAKAFSDGLEKVTKPIVQEFLHSGSIFGGTPDRVIKAGISLATDLDESGSKMDAPKEENKKPTAQIRKIPESFSTMAKERVRMIWLNHDTDDGMFLRTGKREYKETTKKPRSNKILDESIGKTETKTSSEVNDLVSIDGTSVTEDSKKEVETSTSEKTVTEETKSDEITKPAASSKEFYGNGQLSHFLNLIEARFEELFDLDKSIQERYEGQVEEVPSAIRLRILRLHIEALSALNSVLGALIDSLREHDPSYSIEDAFETLRNSLESYELTHQNVIEIVYAPLTQFRARLIARDLKNWFVTQAGVGDLYDPEVRNSTSRFDNAKKWVFKSAKWGGVGTAIVCLALWGSDIKNLIHSLWTISDERPQVTVPLITPVPNLETKAPNSSEPIVDDSLEN